MGLFDKLFSNKDKQTDKKISESEIKKHFDSPYGKFWYSSTPACQEYGYECEIDWNDGDDEKALVFVTNFFCPFRRIWNICFEAQKD